MEHDKGIDGDGDGGDWGDDDDGGDDWDGGDDGDAAA